MSETLLVQQQEHIAIITLNNPPANTWTIASLKQLENIITELNNNKRNCALIIHSNSEKFFSAGADLNTVNHRDKSLALEFAQAFGDAFQALSDYQGVSIAAITGYAMGGGLEAALCCDIRLCEQQAKMALPEASVGLLPCGLGTQQLPWLIGEGWAKRMILLGEHINAKQAVNIGLVQELVATGKVLTKALELAQLAAKQSPTALRHCKNLIMQARNNSMAEALQQERELFVQLWDDQNQQEGVSAFLEKRQPVWKP
ncbi:enoyl-CoA hydratase [Dasania sp. GY-MA-18]|uniref:Enoyl-CoA hydratase n=1 Tax=Dasania phycosphaerae TaxID=2950436 RepID=A0A9J6RGJ8_9GAMM|nr:MULTISPECIES: enoyl-CoA hydratase [Dasania]MCR8921346.1 enoyl-CoA hydratase [Dasania sp. GY-MA-18]MCZ0863774.1 enoyl-CoA hydratase [Dasania phycosphaerae]MCZ0867502.1 enoyl-CoA hydratase [Dasania phycosphaerae]